jgi:hypothetical protein
MLLAAVMALAMEAPAAGAAGSRPAPGTLEMFRSLCVANESQMGEAIRRADAMRWIAPPKEAMDGVPPMMKQMHNLQVRMFRQSDGGGYVLMTGNDVDLLNSGHPPPNASCIVMGINRGAADTAIKTDTSAWMGAQPIAAGGSMFIYAYTEKNGARTYLSDAQERETREAFDGGKLKVVALDAEPTASLLLYIVPTPQAN